MLCEVKKSNLLSEKSLKHLVTAQDFNQIVSEFVRSVTCILVRHSDLI